MGATHRPGTPCKNASCCVRNADPGGSQNPQGVPAFVCVERSKMRRAVFCFLLVLWFLLLTGCASQTLVSSGGIVAVPVHTAKINGVELGYRIIGEGPPLLMIMGYAGTMEIWDAAMISALSENHTLILYDHRGTGYSTIDQSPLTIAQMMRDAACLLDALGIHKADIMGWSMGSIIAQEMVLAYPGRVRKVVLYATAVDREPVQKALDAMAAMQQEEFAARLFPPEWKALHPDIYARLPDAANVPADVIMRQYQAITRWPGTRERLAEIDQSVLVLVGEADRVTLLSQSLTAASLIPGAWVARFTAADHWLMYQAPKELAKTVHFFLSIEQDLLLVQ